MNLRFKPNILIVWTQTNLAIAEAFCQACREIVGEAYVPTLTSGMDGQHSAESGHYYGRALDFRSHDLPDDTTLRQGIKTRVGVILGDRYLCLLEPTHFHIQRQRNSF